MPLSEKIDRAVAILCVLGIVGWFGYQALQPLDTTQPPAPFPVYQHPEEYQP